MQMPLQRASARVMLAGPIDCEERSILQDAARDGGAHLGLGLCHALGGDAVDLGESDGAPRDTEKAEDVA